MADTESPLQVQSMAVVGGGASRWLLSGGSYIIRSKRRRE